MFWLAGLMILIAALLGGCRRGQADTVSVTPSGVAAMDEKTLRSRVQGLQKENERLEGRLEKLMPKEPYIVVNTTLNHIYLRKGEDVVLDGICSTGSNTELMTTDGKKKWFFSTPRGVFKVRRKMEKPVWVRPDWAFIEEGEPVPGPNAPERFEEGVLGDYGLYLGNGYLIHGTLFQRFLGQSVTHGCIRVGDEDLAQIWQAARVGTPVYIF